MARAIFIVRPGLLTARALDDWLKAGHEIAEVWTGPGSRHGLKRHRDWFGRLPRDWDAEAIVRTRGLRVRAVRRLHDWPEAPDAIRATGADTLVTSLTTQIVPAELIALFEGRALNLHPALLPRYRGPSPTPGMLLDGAEEQCGGVTLHVLAAGIDTGPIVAQRAVSFAAAGRDYQRWQVALAQCAGALLAHAGSAYLAGRLATVPQDEAQASYRRVAGETRIGAHLTLAEARHALAVLGAAGRVVTDSPPPVGERRLRSLRRVLGPATGAAPELGPLRIRLDLADARVELTRYGPLDKLAAHRATLRQIRIEAAKATGR